MAEADDSLLFMLEPVYSINKLEETEFFLKQTRDAKNWTHALFFLSAYLSAARSVTFVLKKDYKRSRGFEEWYGLVEKRLAESELGRVALKARNRFQKQGNRLSTELRADGPDGEIVIYKRDLEGQMTMSIDMGPKYQRPLATPETEDLVAREIVGDCMNRLPEIVDRLKHVGFRVGLQPEEHGARDDLTDGLEKHTALLREIVEEAYERFGGQRPFAALA